MQKTTLLYVCWCLSLAWFEYGGSSDVHVLEAWSPVWQCGEDTALQEVGPAHGMPHLLNGLMLRGVLAPMDCVSTVRVGC
jgi:hypothetical protein